MVAFMLNIAAVFLVSAGSGLVLTLAGVFKDILLISGSVLIFGALITPLQVLGTSSLLDRTSCAARMCTNRALDRLLDRAPWSHPLQDHRQQVSVGRKVLSVVSRTLPCRSPSSTGTLSFGHSSWSAASTVRSCFVFCVHPDLVHY